MPYTNRNEKSAQTIIIVPTTTTYYKSYQNNRRPWSKVSDVCEKSTDPFENILYIYTYIHVIYLGQSTGYMVRGGTDENQRRACCGTEKKTPNSLENENYLLQVPIRTWAYFTIIYITIADNVYCRYLFAHLLLLSGTRYWRLCFLIPSVPVWLISGCPG